MFTWRAQGHSLEAVTELFRQAAVEVIPFPEGLSILARRLANPIADMEDHWGIIFSLPRGITPFHGRSQGYPNGYLFRITSF
ncbi:hypothetical protein IV102_06500 [bacterium]|nr:hypothetical protein [bacterium]